MQLEKIHTDDLDYLADLGFEAISVSEKQLLDIQNKINKRTSQQTFGNLVSYLSAVLFLATTVFFMYYNHEVIWATFPEKKSIQPIVSVSDTVVENGVKETVTPVAEKFKKNEEHFVSKSQTTESNLVLVDTMSVLELSPKTLVNSLPNTTAMPRLKYPINNGDIVYIHHLKVSSYYRLYFKKQLVNDELNNVPAAYAYSNTDNVSSANRLKTSATIYLHQQLSDALLAYQKKQYGTCLVMLSQIATYTTNDVNCNFYSALCYYHLKNYAMALRNFDECLSALDNAFYEEALFYKALALKEIGKEAESKALLKQIADTEGFYTEKAARLIK